MVVRTPSLVYIYLSIVSRNTINENKVFLLFLSLSTKLINGFSFNRSFLKLQSHRSLFFFF